jgi:Type I phosphodiesterase / nucleotide pyrophosphatase
MSAPVFVFGISGATWRVIDPLLTARRMPNFARLLQEGCRADLLSVRAPEDKHFRPQVAWASLATGCLPARHGITRFYHSADDLQVPNLWQLFERAGLSVGIYGWPLDWPPGPTNGFIIPSHLARDTRTWPPELSSIKALDREQQDAERSGRRMKAPGYAQIVANLLRHGLRAHTLLKLAATFGRTRLLASPEARSLLLRQAKLDLSTDLFVGLCRRYSPSLRCFHTFYVDFVSHRFWRYHEPELFGPTAETDGARFHSAVADAYVHTDAALGRMLDTLPAQAFVAVMSEHGMQAEPLSAEVGRWRYLIDAQKLSAFIGLESTIVGAPVARWIAYRARIGSRMPIDTADRLRRVRVLETGLPLFQIYQHGAEEIVVKFRIDAEVPLYREGRLDQLTLCFDGKRATFQSVTRRLGATRSAMHDERGILLLRGPGVPCGRLPDVRAVDIAPTLLRFAGIPVPAGMDGAPLEFLSGAVA